MNASHTSRCSICWRTEIIILEEASEGTDLCRRIQGGRVHGRKQSVPATGLDLAGSAGLTTVRLPLQLLPRWFGLAIGCCDRTSNLLVQLLTMPPSANWVAFFLTPSSRSEATSKLSSGTWSRPSPRELPPQTRPCTWPSHVSPRRRMKALCLQQLSATGLKSAPLVALS